MAFAHGEKLQRQSLAFAIVSKDVDVAIGRRRHLLLLGKFDYGLAQVAILGGHLVTHLSRRLLHALFQRVGEFRVSSFEQQAHVAHRFLILFRRAQSFDARAETALDVILKTRPRRLAVDFDVAGAQLKSAIDYVDRSARHAGRQKRSKVKRAVFLNAARDHRFGKRLVDRQFQMRIRLVVF